MVVQQQFCQPAAFVRACVLRPFKYNYFAGSMAHGYLINKQIDYRVFMPAFLSPMIYTRCSNSEIIIARECRNPEFDLSHTTAVKSL